jgi:hypothetical protein
VDGGRLTADGGWPEVRIERDAGKIRCGHVQVVCAGEDRKNLGGMTRIFALDDADFFGTRMTRMTRIFALDDADFCFG